MTQDQNNSESQQITRSDAITCARSVRNRVSRLSVQERAGLQILINIDYGIMPLIPAESLPELRAAANKLRELALTLLPKLNNLESVTREVAISERN